MTIMLNETIQASATELDPDSPFVIAASQLPSGAFPPVSVDELNQQLMRGTPLRRAMLNDMGDTTFRLWAVTPQPGMAKLHRPEDTMLLGYSASTQRAMLSWAATREKPVIVIVSGSFVALCHKAEMRIAMLSPKPPISNIVCAPSPPDEQASFITGLIDELAFKPS